MRNDLVEQLKYYWSITKALLKSFVAEITKEEARDSGVSYKEVSNNSVS
jgi:hypothetical protein